MPRLEKIAEKFNLTIVEDAAEALGAKIDNQKIGAEKCSCFEF